MIKAIIFDCFGVLTADTWKEFTSTIKPEHVREASVLNHDYDAGKITKPEFLTAVQKLTGQQPVYVDDMLDNETEKNVLLLKYIATLKPKYKIGLLSNVATNWIRDYFLTAKEQGLFDVMVFSFEVGMTKPHPDIFQHICKQLGVLPEESVMVDDINRYCNGARETGMQAVQYQDFQQFKADLEQVLSHT